MKQVSEDWVRLAAALADVRSALRSRIMPSLDKLAVLTSLDPEAAALIDQARNAAALQANRATQVLKGRNGRR